MGVRWFRDDGVLKRTASYELAPYRHTLRSMRSNIHVRHRYRSNRDFLDQSMSHDRSYSTTTKSRQQCVPTDSVGSQ
jgi:hypothetical protein